MNRRQLLKTTLGIAVASASAIVYGCRKPTPKEVEEGQTACEHEWVEAQSGEMRCMKCGIYKKD